MISIGESTSLPVEKYPLLDKDTMGIRCLSCGDNDFLHVTSNTYMGGGYIQGHSREKISLVFKNIAAYQWFMETFFKMTIAYGSIPFYMQLPLFGGDKFYLLKMIGEISEDLCKKTVSFSTIEQTTEVFNDTIIPTSEHYEHTVYEGSADNEFVINTLTHTVYDSYFIVSDVSNGFAYVVDNTIYYTPRFAFEGDDYILFKVFNGVNYSDTYSIKIEVMPRERLTLMVEDGVGTFEEVLLENGEKIQIMESLI